MTIDVDEIINTDLSELVWEMPIPFCIPTQSSSPYPVQALPAIIRHAVLTYQQYGQQPLPLLACSALANVSLACQLMANVARDRLLISPVSLYFLCVATSGERKSNADHVFGQGIRQWEQDTRDALIDSVHKARSLHHAWLVEKNAVLTQIRRCVLADEDELYPLKERLIQLSANEPSIPMLPTLFFEDVTQEALALHLAQGWPSASLWSDEGGSILYGHGMQNNAGKFVALLNRLWDGKSFITHRKTTQSFKIDNRRLTMNLMLQPSVFQQLLSKSNHIARQSGFLARALIAYPDSAIGARYYQEPPLTLTALTQFHQRLADCLESSLLSIEKGIPNMPLLSFTPKAKATWISFFDSLEKGLTHAQQWREIKDFASKAAENTARLSALFHLFDGKADEINHECVEAATEVIHWHLWETRRILEPDPISTAQQDAMKLLKWLIDKEICQITPRILQQYSPLRDKTIRDNAIQVLLEQHYLKEHPLDGKTVLWLNPRLK